MNAQRANRLEKRKQEWGQALTRATHNTSLCNYATIIREFSARGIPVEDIRPRENVFTFKAWKALGRYVRKGEKGVHVITMQSVSRQVSEPVFDEYEMIVEPGKTENRRIFAGAVVFHISQTEAYKA